MNKYGFLALLFTLTVVSSLLALDIDPADGISDVYQQIYGIAPLDSDNDADGLDYQTEAALGTDPNTPDSGLLMIGWEDSSSDTGLVLKLSDVKGIRYELDESPDLLHWKQTGLFFSGDADPAPIKIPIANSEPRLFWRVRGVGFEDSGDDALNDFEEYLLGTKIDSQDSDGDQISDVEEFLKGSLPDKELDPVTHSEPIDFQMISSNRVVRYFGVLGRYYMLERSEDGINWTPVFETFGGNKEIVYSEVQTAPEPAFRLRYGTTGFVAYNDSGRRDTLPAAPDITYYCAGAGASRGPLINSKDGSPTSVFLTIPGVAYSTYGVEPASGTPASEVFGGFIQFDSGAYGEAIELKAVEGDSYTYRFSGLNPARTYTFTGTAVSGISAYAKSWIKVTVVNPDGTAGVAAHSSGDGVVPISPGEAALWTGDNSGPGQGFVLSWEGMDPGEDGVFEIVCEQYTGTIPVQIDPSGRASGSKAYALNAVRLEEKKDDGTTFIAYNDTGRVGAPEGLSPHVTSFDRRGNDGVGKLLDSVTGLPTEVTLAIGSARIGKDGGATPHEDTPASNIFGRHIRFASGLRGETIRLVAAEGDFYTYRFTGLDASRTYTFTGTAVYGNSDYTDRWTKAVLINADASPPSPAHSGGPGVVSDPLKPNEAALWTGGNSGIGEGYVLSWSDIHPGPDGAFDIRCEQYLGPVSTQIDPEGTASTGEAGYALDAILLEEQDAGVTTFSAFNDAGYDSDHFGFATSYSFDEISGTLRDVGSGADTSVNLSISQSGVSPGQKGLAPAPDSDVQKLFGGWIDFTSNTVGESLQLNASGYYIYTFSGLDPQRFYTFAGTAVCGDGEDSACWTKVTLENDDGDLGGSAHSSGNGVIELSSNQAALWTGNNGASGQGSLLSWVGIRPGLDGVIKIKCEPYSGSTSGVGGGTADGSKAYALDAVYLEETTYDAAPLLAVEALPNIQNRLSWTDYTDAEEGFEIERQGPDEESFTQIAVVEADVTTFIDQDPSLQAESAYIYRVRAFSSDGWSGYSPQVEVVSSFVDIDMDSLPDSWERAYFGNLDQYATGDFDGDGVLNIQEFQHGGLPNDLDGDSDNDGTQDFVELFLGTQLNDPVDGASLDIAPWSGADIGTVRPGYYSKYEDEESERYLILGTGKDLKFNEDQLHFLRQSLSADFEFSAKVDFLDPLGGNSYAGLMVRATDDPGSPCGGIWIRNERNEYSYTGRVSQDQVPVVDKNVESVIPGSAWVKVKRHRDRVTGYYSHNGVDWVEVRSVAINLEDSVEVGMACISGDLKRYMGAQFSHVVLALDTDADGVFDEEEASRGTNINNPDSDNDGFSDFDEIYIFHSDPTAKDLGAVTNVGDPVKGASATVLSGVWTAPLDSLMSYGVNGKVDFTINVPSNGVYLLDINTEVLDNSTSNSVFNYVLSIDGEFVDRIDFQAEPRVPTHLRLVTPWLTAGAHTLNLFWDNTLSQRRILIHAIQVQEVGGPDANNNGVADWIETRLAALNAVETTTIESPTSPFCLEGRSRFLSHLSVTQTNADLSVTPKPLPSDRWYADVPLEASALTAIRVDYESGAIFENVSVNWTATNLFTSENLVIRKGDSLKMVAHPEDASSGSFTVAIPGEAPLSSSWNAPIIHTFDQAGSFEVSVTYDDGAPHVRKLTIDVLAASFDPEARFVLKQGRYWDVPGLPDGAMIEADGRMLAKDQGPLDGGGRRLRVMADSLDPRYIAARIGEEGPVLAVSKLKVIRLSTGRDTSLTYAYKNIGNDRFLIEMVVMVSEVFDGIRVEIDTVNLPFAGGSYETLVLTAKDFDAFGRAVISFEQEFGDGKNPCHRIKIFQNGVFIGSND